MTIEQLAAQLKVTRQAIVNKLRRAGVSFAQLSKGKQGKTWILTEEGAERIRDMMRKSAAQKVDNGQAENLEDLQQKIQQKQTTIEEQQRTIEEQRIKIEEQQRTIEEQRTRLEQLDKTIQAQAITAATQAATIQSMQQAAMQRIEAPAEKKPGMWARIAARIGGKKGKAEGQGGS